MAPAETLRERHTKGGTMMVGSLNLYGGVKPLTDPVGSPEPTVDMQATTLLMPVTA